jgi:hypothetical protein
VDANGNPRYATDPVGHAEVADEGWWMEHGPDIRLFAVL